MIEVALKTEVYTVSYSREDYDDLIYNRDEELFNLYMKLRGMAKQVADKRKKYAIYKHMNRIKHMLENTEYLFS